MAGSMIQWLSSVLSSIPATAWAAMGAAVVTALAAFGGASVTHRAISERLRVQLGHDVRVAELDRARKRIEDLYIELDKWLIAYAAYYLPFGHAMQGTITYNQALEPGIKERGDSHPDFGRVEMSIEMYFGELKEKFRRMKDALTKTNDVLAAYKSQCNEGIFDGSAFLGPFRAAMLEVQHEGDAMKAEIVLIGRRIEGF